jgi:N6-L-threonylcarbamoyladenine synthase
MTEEVYLGIDTSCYTTSLFFMDREGHAAAEARRILKVKPGGCGLQQSEMLYQHTRNLPELMEEAARGHRFTVRGIGVSARPRPREDSYMPAFLAGLGFARSLAALYGIPLWQISHQENHLEAALWSANGPDADRFLFLHASGGTTDLLLAVKESSAYKLTEIGGSLDLHAGQFVDRVGVALGLGFPAGPALEQLAEQHTEIPQIPVSVHKTKVSLSGPCTWVLRAIEKAKQETEISNQSDSVNVADGNTATGFADAKQQVEDSHITAANLAAGVQWGLAETFVRMIRNGAAEHNVKHVSLAGGVCANRWIRNHIVEKLAKRGIRVWMPDNRYSGDNASGCAAYARRQGEGQC